MVVATTAAWQDATPDFGARPLDGVERQFVDAWAGSFAFNRYRNFSLISATEAAQVLAESAAEAGTDVTRLWRCEGSRPLGMLRIVDLPWDTDLYERKMGRITHLCGDLDGESISHLLDRTDFDHLAVRVDASDLPTQRAVTQAGFFPVDSILTYLYHVDREDPPEATAANSARSFIYRPYKAADRDSILRITSRCYARYHSRYHADPLLREHSAARYLGWAEKYVDGEADQICVAESNGRVVGFIAFRYDRPLYHVLDRGCYGAGLGASLGGDYLNLLRYTLLCDKEIPWHWAECDTQIDNYAVHRIYQQLNLEYVRAEHTYHLHRG
jgi:hypothetical protein